MKKSTDPINLVFSSLAVMEDNVLNAPATLTKIYETMIEWERTADKTDQEAMNAVHAIFDKLNDVPIDYTDLVDFSVNFANLAKNGTMSSVELKHMRERVSAYLRKNTYHDQDEPEGKMFWSRRRMGVTRVKNDQKDS